MSKGIVALLAWPFGILLAIGWGLVPSPRRAVHSDISRQETRLASTARSMDINSASNSTRRTMEAVTSPEVVVDVAARVAEAMAVAEAAKTEAEAARAEAHSARAEAVPHSRAEIAEARAYRSEAISISRAPLQEMPPVPSLLTYFLLATGPGVVATARWRRSVVQARAALSPQF